MILTKVEHKILIEGLKVIKELSEKTDGEPLKEVLAEIHGISKNLYEGCLFADLLETED